MKFWRKPDGSLVIEFEREQDETTRFAYVLGDGARHYRMETRELYDIDDIHVRAAISAYMTKVMLDTYLIGTNYSQEFGTEKEPKVYHIKDFIASAIANYDNKWNTDKWNAVEIDIMDRYSWEEII